MKHLLTCNDLSEKSIQDIFLLTAEFKRMRGAPVQKKFADDVVALLFIEPSTRTRLSFEVAALNQGAKVVQVFPDRSSLVKGETLEDTVLNLYAIGCRYFVIRHSETDVFENLLTIERPGMKFINAGNGIAEHPSQALLDVFSILEKVESLKNLNICILGDILRSRVAKSNMILMSKLGANVRVSGPEELMPKEIDVAGVELFKDPDEAASGADVIMALRVQVERGPTELKSGLNHYLKSFGLSKARYGKAKPGAWIMHPGPMQRGVEIDSDLADGDKSLIFRQVENGVFVRMAILEYLSVAS